MAALLADFGAAFADALVETVAVGADLAFVAAKRIYMGVEGGRYVLPVIGIVGPEKIDFADAPGFFIALKLRKPGA